MASRKKRISSQTDLFRDSDMDTRKEKQKPRPSASYDPAQKPYQYLYEYVILFNWDVDLADPFSHYSLNMFKDKDIKPEWISKNLGINSRISKLRNLSPFPGQVFSLFSKIELGKEYIYMYILCIYYKFNSFKCVIVILFTNN